MRAVVFDLSIPRYVVAKTVGKVALSLYDGDSSCLRVRHDVAEPALPAADWVKLRPHRVRSLRNRRGDGVFQASAVGLALRELPVRARTRSLATVAAVGPRGSRRARRGSRRRRPLAQLPRARDAALRPLRRRRIPSMRAHRARPHERDDFGRLCRSARRSRRRHGRAREPALRGADLRHRWPRRARPSRSPSPSMPCCAILRARANACSSSAAGPSRSAPSLRWASSTSTPISRFTRSSRPISTRRAPWARTARILSRDGKLLDIAAELTRAPRLKPVLGPEFLAGGFDRVFDCVGSVASLGRRFRRRAAGRNHRHGRRGRRHAQARSLVSLEQRDPPGGHARLRFRRARWRAPPHLRHCPRRAGVGQPAHRSSSSPTDSRSNAFATRSAPTCCAKKAAPSRPSFTPEIENEVRHVEKRSGRSPPPLGAQNRRPRRCDARARPPRHDFPRFAPPPSGSETRCAAVRARSRCARSRSPPSFIRRNTPSAAPRCRPRPTCTWSIAAFSYK